MSKPPARCWTLSSSESADADVLIMAAAVADFRPEHTSADKLKSRDGVPHLELEATEDILKAVAARKRSPQPGTSASVLLANRPGQASSPRPSMPVDRASSSGFAAESRDLARECR